MKRLILGGVLCVLFGFSAPVRADGLVQSLPKDGSWVKFYVEMKSAKKIITSATYTIRSVGRSKVDGMPCRWIELHLEQTQNGKTTKLVTKVLVAEEDFPSKSKRPPKIIRGWLKTDGNDPRKLTEKEKSANAPTAFIVTIPLKDRKTLLKKKVLDYQKGRLTIKSCVTGKWATNPSAPAYSGVAVTESIWSDSSIPFGTAALQYEMQAQEGKMVGPKTIMTFTLQDYGNGAKSALPGKR